MTLFNIVQPRYFPAGTRDEVVQFAVRWKIVGSLLATDASAALREAKRQGFHAPVIAQAQEQASEIPS